MGQGRPDALGGSPPEGARRSYRAKTADFFAHAAHMHTETAIVIGLVNVFLPYLVLSVVASLQAIDPAVPRAAAGLGAFSIESARDLVQFMVRRSQMTQDEADKLLATAEDAAGKNRRGKKPVGKKPAGKAAAKPAPAPASSSMSDFEDDIPF